MQTVNIAKKVGYFLDVNKYKEKLKNFTYKGEARIQPKGNVDDKRKINLPRSG